MVSTTEGFFEVAIENSVTDRLLRYQDMSSTRNFNVFSVSHFKYIYIYIYIVL